ncbi:MAG: SseB family protein [Myxococcota bacterium]
MGLRNWRKRRGQRRVLAAHLTVLDESRFVEHRCAVQFGLSRVFVRRVAKQFEVQLLADCLLDPYLEQRDEVHEELLASHYQLRSGVSGLQFSKAFESAAEVARALDALIYESLNYARDAVYSVALEYDRAADSPELRKAMKALAKLRSPDARHSVYRHLVASTMLLAMQTEPSDGSPTDIRVQLDGKELSGRPVWLAFSGHSALESNSEAKAFVSLSGVRLIQAALHAKIGSLRLDHGCQVGGELYGSELATIADAIVSARPPGWAD